MNIKKTTDIALLACIFCLGLFTYSKWSTAGFAGWDWHFLKGLLVQHNSIGKPGSGLLVKGLAVTLQLSFWVFLFSMALGILISCLRTAGATPLRYLALSYVVVIRNIPPLVLIFVFYFFLGTLIAQIVDWHAIGKSLQSLPGSWFFIPTKWTEPFFTAVIALSVYQSTYISEIFRAGIEGIPGAQVEAGKALGMHSGQLFLYVILPQAWRFILPPLVSQISILIKNSSLAAVITIPELVNTARLISDSGAGFLEVWLAVAFLYFFVCTAVTRFGAWLEKKCAFS